MRVLSRSIFFMFLLSGILSGILLGNTLSDIGLIAIILGTFCLPLFIISRHYRQVLILLAVILSGAILGVSSSLYSQGTIQKNLQIVDKYQGLYNGYLGVVEGIHKRSEYHDEYVIDLRHIDNEGFPYRVKHVLRIPKNFSLYPGQEISYNGKMYPLKDFDGFSYKRYMLSQGLYFSSSTNSIQTISEKRYGWKYRFYKSRQQLLSRINQIFPEREAIFLGGILFGARENIPKDLKEDFNNSGLTHFIAVSGFNITLCVIFITFLFGFFPRNIRIVLVSITIISFSFFVGLGAPVVRAAIMGILGYIFLQSGNSAKAIVLLLFTAVCMTILNPLALTYDVSLHLSFLAVIGIMYTQELFQKLFFWAPNTFAIREALVLTLSALSFSLPIMIFQFGQVSLLAPLANIAVTWTIPLAMIGGAVTLIVDFFSPLLGGALGFITWILLKFDMLMVHFFGNIEWAVLELDFGPYSIYLQCLYFIILAYFLTLYHQKKKTSEEQSEATILKLRQRKQP